MEHPTLQTLVTGDGAINRSHYQVRRRDFLRRFIELETRRGLEFGGFDLPTVPAELGDCATADMRSEYQLSKDFGISLDEIRPVDCITEPGLAAYRQIGLRFDYVVLCHVLEHIPDVITMMNDLSELLEPGGILFIALPDKRKTLDASRNSTTLARLVERLQDHTNVPSISEIAEFSLAWIPTYRELYKKSMHDFFHEMRSHQLFGNPDVHCNVWRDDEFLEQTRSLIEGDYLTDLEIVGTQPTEPSFNEFYLALRRPFGPTQVQVMSARSTERPIRFRTCNFCGHGQFKVWKRIHSPFPEQLYADSIVDAEIGRELSLQYLTCRHCDLSSINPLPTFETIDRHQFSVGDVLERSDAEINALIEDRQRVTGILSDQYEFERYRQTGRLLDVSCGPGIGLAWLRDQRGWEVSGVEPAREFVDFARERFGLEISNALVEDLTEPDGSFDVIVIDSSLQCMFSPLETLIACHRLLREGGCLFVQSPNRDGVGSDWADLNTQWGHWFFYTPPVLHRILEKIGFRSERILAIQNTIDPRVQERMPADSEILHESIEAALRSPDEIDRYLEQGGPFRADFFGLSARKLPESDRRPGADFDLSQLEAIAACSRRPRHCVAIDPDTDVCWPWEQADFATNSTDSD